MIPGNFIASLVIGFLVVLSLVYQPFDPNYPGVNAFITFVLAVPILALGVFIVTYFEERK